VFICGYRAGLTGLGLGPRIRVSHVGAADGTTKQNDAADEDAAQYVPEKRVKPRRVRRPVKYAP